MDKVSTSTDKIRGILEIGMKKNGFKMGRTSLRENLVNVKGFTMIGSSLRKHHINVKGFTLIELLVVIVFVSIMVLAAIYASTPSLFKGHDARRKADMDFIGKGLEEYVNDHGGCYVSSLPACGDYNGALSHYIKAVPCDPVKGGPGYVYETNGTTCPRWYKLYTILENEDDPIISKVGCDAGCGPGNLYNYFVSSGNAL